MPIQEGLVRVPIVMTIAQREAAQKAVGKENLSKFIRKLLAENIKGFEDVEIKKGTKTVLPPTDEG